MDASENSIIKLPLQFGFFKGAELSDFSNALSWFDWTLEGDNLTIDLTECQTANYQTLSLILLYIWRLSCNGSKISISVSGKDALNLSGAERMWKNMGAQGWYKVLRNQEINFDGTYTKPLFALRNSSDFDLILERIMKYTASFRLEYIQTMRYLISELLYNTLEHGSATLHGQRIPSLVQFNWYKRQNKLAFIIADLGIGIKRHLEQSYPGFENDSQAILYALRPQITGTKSVLNPYTEKNNAGMGLYLTSNIIRNLKANMYIISGKGLVHISPVDFTSKELSSAWHGTFVYVTIQLSNEDDVNLEKLMSEFRAKAMHELQNGNGLDEQIHYLNMRNYFGSNPVNKESAIWYRNEKLIPALEEGKTIRMDFSDILTAPHSFLSALIATPIKKLGLEAYRRIKIINASPELRETIDYIFEENTL